MLTQVAASGDDNSFFPALFTHCEYTRNPHCNLTSSDVSERLRVLTDNVRDVLKRVDLNGGKVIAGDFTSEVPGMDAMMVRITPTDVAAVGRAEPPPRRWQGSTLPTVETSANVCDPGAESGGCNVCGECCWSCKSSSKSHYNLIRDDADRLLAF